MEINKKFKIWEACADDKMRPTLNYIHFKDAHAYASDAHILVKIPIKELLGLTAGEDYIPEALEGHCISGNIWKKLAAQKAAQKGMMELYLPTEEGGAPSFRVHDEEGQDIIFHFAKKGMYTPPYYEGVLKRSTTAEAVTMIGLSEKMLSKLCQALGDTDVKMDFNGPLNAVLVFPKYYDELTNAYGMIMPRML